MALAVSAVFVLTTLLSFCFIVREADHDCSGASCSTCAVVQLCEENLTQIAVTVTAGVTAAVVCCYICREITADVFFTPADTLIRRKVRMNN